MLKNLELFHNYFFDKPTYTHISIRKLFVRKWFKKVAYKNSTLLLRKLKKRVILDF